MIYRAHECHFSSGACVEQRSQHRTHDDTHTMQEVVELPDYHKITFPPLMPIPLHRLLPNASPAAIALLSKLLVYNPAQRISAREALTDVYFFSEPLPTEPRLLPVVDKGGGKAKAAVLLSDDDVLAPIAYTPLS